MSETTRQKLLIISRWCQHTLALLLSEAKTIEVDNVRREVRNLLKITASVLSGVICNGKSPSVTLEEARLITWDRCELPPQVTEALVYEGGPDDWMIAVERMKDREGALRLLREGEPLQRHQVAALLLVPKTFEEAARRILAGDCDLPALQKYLPGVPDSCKVIAH
jgi:hypothetical protein